MFIPALVAEDRVYDLVLYTWNGLGAAFGSLLLFVLWSKTVTKAGIVAGMLVGAISVIVWNNVTPSRASSMNSRPPCGLSAYTPNQLYHRGLADEA